MRTGAFLKATLVSVLLLPAAGGWSDVGISHAQGDCDANGDAWTNTYRFQANYVPGMPMNSTPSAVKTVHFSIHIWPDPGGLLSLLNDPWNIPFLNQAITAAQFSFESVVLPSDPIQPIIYYQPFTDTKVRFALDAIYFNANTNVFAGMGNNGDAMNVAAIAEHPECENTINIHFIHFNNVPGGSGQASPLVMNDFTDVPWILRASGGWWMNDTGTAVLAGSFGHEIAHLLGLMHLYQQAGGEPACLTTDPDFLSDIWDLGSLFCGLPDCGDICWVGTCSNPQPAQVYNPAYDCNNNIMGGTNVEDQVFTSPLQMGRMHRSLMAANVAPYAWGYDPVPYTVQQDEIWDYHVKFYQDIIVPAGVTLTVTCELHMVPEARIIVQPGGRLIVDGGRIQAALFAPARWRGIEVRGNGNLPQTFANQGYLELRNGAEIADAQPGIFVGSSINLNGGGGIVRSFGSSQLPIRITNCATSVRFYPYLYPIQGSPGIYAANASQFYGTRFEANSQYMEYVGGTPFTQHVRLDRVYGLRFRSCTYINTRDAVTSAELGHGIRSNDANYSVDNSRFEGLDHGIHSTGVMAHAWFRVQASVFKNNICGAYVSGQFGCRMIGNRFIMGLRDVLLTGPEDAQMFPYHRGIFTHQTFKFTIQGNVLQRDSDPLAVQLTEGIVIGYARDWNDVVRSNRAINLDRGFVGEGVNCSTTGYASVAGLQFKCNENQNTLVNIWSRPDGSVPPILQATHSIRTLQGDLTSTADNKFDNWPSGNPLTDDFRVTNPQMPIKYLHRAGAPFPPTDFTPILLSPWLITPPPAFTCPTITEPPFMMAPQDPLLSQLELENEKLAYGNVRYQYEQLIDGGNTDEVVDEIMDAWPQGFLELRTYLLDRSPYLSVEVLKEAMAKPGFPDAIRAEVCIANPEATQKEGFIKWIQVECAYPLPEYLIGSIVASWETKTYRATLEAQMGAHHERYSQAAVEWADHYLSDTIQVPLDTLLRIFREVRTHSARYAEANILLEQGAYAAAEAVMVGLPLEHELKTPEVLEQQRMLAWIDIVQAIRQSSRTLELDLTPAEIAQIDALIEDVPDLPATWMSNLLCFHYDICRPVHTGGEEEPKSLPYTTSHIPSAPEKATLRVVPNPATAWLSIAFDTKDGDAAEAIEVRDIMGRIVHRTTITGSKGQIVWDCRSVPAGTYTTILVSASGNALVVERAIIRP